MNLIKKIIERVRYWLNTVEVCPREMQGWECKYSHACNATHYRMDRKEYEIEMAKLEAEAQAAMAKLRSTL